METDDLFGQSPLDSEMNFETDMISVVEDKNTDDEEELSRLERHLQELFYDAEYKRINDENRWLQAYRNYRGIYGPNVQFSKHEKSRVFVKLTKVKVLAAYAQIIDVLFGSHKFPLSVDPTQLPDGIAESAHMSLNPVVQANPQIQQVLAPTPTSNGFRFKADGSVVPNEIVAEGFNGRFGYLKDLVEPFNGGIAEGVGKTPDTVTFSPALVAAKKMEKKIHDQLSESQADKHLRHVAFEMALFGTGVMKGPFVEDKEYPKWEGASYKPLVKTVPAFEAVGVWDYYPDPDAINQDNAEFVFHRHKMSKTQLRKLSSRPFFRKNVIEAVIEKGPNYQRKWWEQELNDFANDVGMSRWEVLEFWGYVETEMLRSFGVKIPREMRKLPQLSANIWVTGGRVIRCVLNPYKPSRIPFYAVPYELNPYSFFGVGVAENMADSQMLINGFMRMAVDNQALSGSLMIEVDSTNLAPGQDMEIYPGKIWVRDAGAPGQAIFGTEFPNVSEQNLKMFSQARILADEATGIPSYSHGQTGIQGNSETNRTASGISMLMNASSGNTRSVIKNLDDYLLGPLGRAAFAFNMQFDPEEDIKGDLEVRARGTESFVSNEVRSQRLMQFLGVVANPLLAPFAKMDKIIREIAKSLELDPDTMVNSMEDAAFQAALMQKLAPQQPGTGTPEEGTGTPTSPPGQPNAPKPPAGADAKDSSGTGGGTLGTGTTPTSREKPK